MHNEGVLSMRRILGSYRSSMAEDHHSRSQRPIQPVVIEDDEYSTSTSDELADQFLMNDDDDDDVASEEDEDLDALDIIPRQQPRSGDGLGTPVASEGNGGIPMMLTDISVLDCPICCDPLSNIIFQCKNGHILCSSCRNKVNDKCPSCRLPIKSERCRVMEQLMESIRVDCKHKTHGCKEMLKYYKKTEHENTCPYEPCFCPFPDCGYANTSKKMYDHFTSNHRSSATSFNYDAPFYYGFKGGQKHAILQEHNDGVIFVLNHDIVQGHGRVFSIYCIGPKSCDGDFMCRLSMTYMRGSLSMECVPDVWANWEHQTPKNYRLTIPFDVIPDGYSSVQVCIKKRLT